MQDCARGMTTITDERVGWPQPPQGQWMDTEIGIATLITLTIFVTEPGGHAG